MSLTVPPGSLSSGTKFDCPTRNCHNGAQCSAHDGSAGCPSGFYGRIALNSSDDGGANPYTKIRPTRPERQSAAGPSWASSFSSLIIMVAMLSLFVVQTEAEGQRPMQIQPSVSYTQCAMHITNTDYSRLSHPENRMVFEWRAYCNLTT
ncbi:multiple epidermal growth factor-like domains protein 11 isoform X1 [Lates japonicus]|uniref:Multiple epidermal growth factor-like domains protein 11 isoform X1 n=1 Tax=Lates japonicus TaxID=270547 RepID=A0AAD3MR04_LATJO|nr:multiple epidermal growth factor-like domains protein 11 isoform X1 [Lates japonicus]